MTRRLILGVVGVAVGAGIGSLVLANAISSGAASGLSGRGALVPLYIVFLAATLTLLSGGITYSENAVDQLAAARASSRRPRRLRAAANRVARRAGVATRAGIGFVART